MAYSTKDLEQKALKAIEEHSVIFIEELVAYLPCGKTSFYEHKLNESNLLKDAIENNRINQKKHLRDQWKVSKYPVLQLALYKLLSNDDELSRLSVKDKDPEQQDQTVSFKFTEVK